MSAPAVSEIKRRPWSQVRELVHTTWLPDSAPHHSVVGQTRSGKSHLIRHGLLPLCSYDRVLILDSKGGDPIWDDCGKSVKRMPSKLNRAWTYTPENPRSGWIRLVLNGTRAERRAQAHEALETVYQEGSWTVVIDETRNITDGAEPGLSLRGDVERLWLMGASNKIMVVAGTQAPRWVPSSFYDQAAFAWIGRVRDTAAQKRLLEVGGLAKPDLEKIAAIPRHEWLLVADGGDYLAHTKPPAKSATGTSH